MRKAARFTLLALAGSAALAGCATGPWPWDGGGDMSFFVTSVGPGKGGDLGGLEGADKHCQALASAAGSKNSNWRAYLSTQGTKGLNDPNVVHARDRIGTGPWHNAKGVMIARNVAHLHSENNNVNKETAIDERGRMVNGRTERPNHHDILTGSRPDGTAFPPIPRFADRTCGNWTKGGAEGAAMTGHHDRGGPIGHEWATSWNSGHETIGCNPQAIAATGGAGLFYCFAAK